MLSRVLRHLLQQPRGRASCETETPFTMPDMPTKNHGIFRSYGQREPGVRSFTWCWSVGAGQAVGRVHCRQEEKVHRHRVERGLVPGQFGPGLCKRWKVGHDHGGLARFGGHGRCRDVARGENCHRHRAIGRVTRISRGRIGVLSA